MPESLDEGQILRAGIDLARSCASASMMGELDAMYDMIEEADPEVLHTAFLYAVTHWGEALSTFLQEGEWARWLITEEIETYDQGD